MATKKTVKKMAKSNKGLAKNQNKTTAARGNTYVLTASGKKKLAETGGQGRIIFDCISAHGPIVSASVVDRVGVSIGCPEPKKTVAFYLATWKKQGYVKFGPKPKAA